MLNVRAEQLRARFLSFFKQKGHLIRDSAPLTSLQDPSLLFINAGMVPLKPFFLEVSRAPARRMASIQSCLRVGGKKSDLEQVGLTARHHTFFEMMGHFGFGGYERVQAMQDAWQFLVQELKIDPERLWVSVYHQDTVTAALWRDVFGVSESRICFCGAEDNFWSMGDVGPCGPCTEIFYDLGPEFQGGPPGSAEQDGPRYLEIWNIVFMEQQRLEDGSLQALETPCIDTGMGLERLLCVLQGVSDNYDTDVFQELVEIIRKKAQGVLPRFMEKVIADHTRAITALLAEGLLPGAEGRAYVLRRLMRRVMSLVYRCEALDLSYVDLASAMLPLLQAYIPNVASQSEKIMAVLAKEEGRFMRTLAQGLQRLQGMLAVLDAKAIFPGSDVFLLYDTYGFPVDVIEDVLREQGRAWDREAFDASMRAQRERSRAQAVFTDLQSPFQGHRTSFIPDQNKLVARVLALAVQSQACDFVDEHSSQATVVFDQSLFYPEGGGQCADRGHMMFLNGAADVVNVSKQGEAMVHHLACVQGRLAVGDEVCLMLDVEARFASSQHHSATHLLHAALRHVLGSHVEQRGSLVTPERLRFDFSHQGPLSQEQMDQIEDWIQQRVALAVPRNTAWMSYEEALASGAMALFEDAYQQQVCVVDFPGVSRELCGGMHVRSTAEIGGFRIVSEEGIADGIRRIEALAGLALAMRFSALQRWRQELVKVSRVEASEIPNRLSALMEKVRLLEKELLELKLAEHRSRLQHLAQHAKHMICMPCSFSGQEMMTLADEARLLYAGWTLFYVPEQLKTTILAVHPHANLEETKAFVRDLEALGSIKCGQKAGFVRGVLHAELSQAQWQAWSQNYSSS